MRVSRTIVFALRHHPDRFNLTMTEDGWVEISQLRAEFEKAGHPFSEADLMLMVAEDDKSRLAVKDGWIRANQGHTIPVDLKLPILTPPKFLLHGTVEKHLASIMRQGLLKGSRHAVHLTESAETAGKAAGRRGEPLLLRVSSGLMQAEGFEFSRSENGVWLVETVPPKFLLCI